MSISIYTIKQDLSDLNSYKDQLPQEVKDSIEKLTDDVNEVVESIDNFRGDVTD